MPEAFWSAFFWSWKGEAQFAAYALLFCLCLARGAAPERILSGVLLAMPAVDRLHHAVVGGSIVWRHADLGHVAIDAVVMACTFVVALHANRVYPLWIAGAQIISVFGHAYRLGLEEINRNAYDTMAVTPSYIQLVAMIAGIAFHMSRRRRLGSYPSWRRSSSLTQAHAAGTSPVG
ncbi:hypothetical protein [Novosphingobium sp. BL-52-GroH]|uniref:hypothetical protein n=1 Tax=Novosphingobium sp. BL-52-GroH TaxID=3349877 RepID=UPI00384CA706